MSRMNLSEVYTPQRDPSLSEKMLTNDKLIRRNSFSSKEDTHYNKFHNTSTTRPNHKLNKSSSCTGFTCLPKQDEIKVIFPKSAWEECRNKKIPTSSKKISFVLPKMHGRKKKKISNNEYFTQIERENNNTVHTNKNPLSKNYPKLFTCVKLSDKISAVALSKTKDERTLSGFNAKKQIVEPQSPKRNDLKHQQFDDIYVKGTSDVLNSLPCTKVDTATIQSSLNEPNNSNLIVVSKTLDYGELDLSSKNESPETLLDDVKTIKMEDSDFLENSNGSDKFSPAKNIACFDAKPREDICEEEVLPKDDKINNLEFRKACKYESKNKMPSKDSAPSIFNLHHTSSHVQANRTKQVNEISFTNMKPKKNGYKPNGKSEYIPFLTMFSKPILPSNTHPRKPANKSLNSNDHVSLNVSIECLTPNDRETLKNTRQILRNQIDMKDNNQRRKKKIPLSIDLCMAKRYSTEIQDSDTEVLKAIEKQSASMNYTVVDYISTNKVTSVISSDCVDMKSKKHNINSKLGNIMQYSKKKVNLEVSTQLSRASPVSSDVETLPLDILESKQVTVNEKQIEITKNTVTSEDKYLGHRSTNYEENDELGDTDLSDHEDILSRYSESISPCELVPRLNQSQIETSRRYPLLISDSRLAALPNTILLVQIWSNLIIPVIFSC